MDLSPRASAFFESYLSAFERMDPGDVAGHFSFPLHMTSDGEPVGLSSIAGPDEWREEIARLVSFYGDVGVTTAQMLAARSIEVSPRVEHAVVHWQLRDASGADVYDFHAVYTLAEIEGATRIVALAHDELPRALAYASGSARA
ncbi:MAG TPA: hypothetical protein VHN37_10570 [Actinomycetota bacterium]|nr:hypothetical protein [Actinomycetota bacterium]